MGQTITFDTNAELYENTEGGLAIRFPDNAVFEAIGNPPEQGFVADVVRLLKREQRRPSWRLIPYRKLVYDERGWHRISRMGFLDGDTSRPALSLDVTPNKLGPQARHYLHVDLPDSVPDDAA